VSDSAPFGLNFGGSGSEPVARARAAEYSSRGGGAGASPRHRDIRPPSSAPLEAFVRRNELDCTQPARKHFNAAIVRPVISNSSRSVNSSSERSGGTRFEN
jgi:hypothetical protein